MGKGVPWRRKWRVTVRWTVCLVSWL